jgi:hypothetical protein
MKAITLTQPWATLMAIGAKVIETRSWYTGYRGPVAIHAAKAFPKWAREFCDERAFRKALGKMDPAGLLRGFVLATGDLAACVETELALAGIKAGCLVLNDYRHGRWRTYPVGADEDIFGDYTPGRYAWVFNGVLALAEPVAARGMFGLWEWDERAGGD